MGRVLVVDDEPDVLVMCRVNLELSGHDVLEAPDGESAIAIARAQRPDIIILDLMLPLTDGFEVLAALALGPTTADIPVVVLTALTQQEDRDRCRDAGAIAYVTKPFSPLRLAEMVDAIVAGRDLGGLESLREEP